MVLAFTAIGAAIVLALGPVAGATLAIAAICDGSGADQGELGHDRGVFVGIWEKVNTAFSTGWTNLVTAVLTPWVEAVAGITLIWSGISQWFTDLWNNIGTAFAGPGEDLRPSVSGSSLL